LKVIGKQHDMVIVRCVAQW